MTGFGYCCLSFLSFVLSKWISHTDKIPISCVCQVAMTFNVQWLRNAETFYVNSLLDESIVHVILTRCVLCNNDVVEAVKLRAMILHPIRTLFLHLDDVHR